MFELSFCGTALERRLGRAQSNGALEGAGPLSLLNDNAIAIRVSECASEPFPVGIERPHVYEARLPQQLAPMVPLMGFRYVEDQQILFRWARRDRMFPAEGELEMKASTGVTEHDPVEALVVLKAADFLQR